MMRALLFAACAACAGSPTSGPTTQEIAIDRVRPAASSDAGDPCPEGARREGGICVTAAAVTCPVGSKLVDGRCAVERARRAGTWQAPAPLVPADLMLARGRYSKGVALFSAGNYNEALIEFEGAYAASAAAPVLFNIGICLEQIDRLEEALDVFNRFLEAAPNGPRAADVHAHMEAIRRKLRP